MLQVSFIVGIMCSKNRCTCCCRDAVFQML